VFESVFERVVGVNMQAIKRQTRKTAKCPFCGSFLCTGVLGESIQVMCREKECRKLIDINFTEKGVQMAEAQVRDSSSATA